MRALTWSVACLAALMVTACGGSGSAKTATPTVVSASPTHVGSGASPSAGPGTPAPLSTLTIQGSPLPPTPISDAQKTAIALGRAVPFKDYTDPGGHYTVGLPEGWTIGAGQTGVSATLAGSPATAQIGVFYVRGSSANQLMRNDRDLQLKVGEGDMPLTRTTSVSVAGASGQEVIWQGFNDGVAHRHWFIYLESHGAAWRFILTTFPNANVDDMLAIFQRMLDSFQFE